MVGVEYPSDLDDHTFSPERKSPGLSLMESTDQGEDEVELGDLEEIAEDLTEE